MITVIEAKKIGSKQGLIFVGIGVLIAQCIMTFLSSQNGIIEGFFWFISFSYNLNLLIGIIILFLNGHFFGQIAGKMILIRKLNYILVGFLSGMAILVSTAFLASWVGFFQEGISNLGTTDNPFFDYILKPVYWVSIFGIVPVFLLGIWFGKRIKKQGIKHHI